MIIFRDGDPVPLGVVADTLAEAQREDDAQQAKTEIVSAALQALSPDEVRGQPARRPKKRI